jgi:hypothetical protein
MSNLIENLILKMLLEDVSEVDGTTELSVTDKNKPTSKSGYDVKLLSTRAYGKGKARSQHAQKIAKQNGAKSAFILTFIKPNKSTTVNNAYILEDIKTICSMGRTIGTGEKAFYNDGIHTFIVVPVKNTTNRKIFHIWIIDSSEYNKLINDIESNIKLNKPITSITVEEKQALTQLQKISIISSDSFTKWQTLFKDLAAKTNTDISTVKLLNFTGVTDMDLPTFHPDPGISYGIIKKDLGNGQVIITVPNEEVTPIKGFHGDILKITSPGKDGTITTTYTPVEGTLVFKDETSKEYTTLTGIFKAGLPVIASSIKYAGIQLPNDIKSFINSDTTQENIQVIGTGTKLSETDYVTLKVFIKNGTAEFNNGKKYVGTWDTSNTNISMQKQALNFKTGYLYNSGGEELGTYIDGKFSKANSANKNILTNVNTIDSVTYPFEWQTTAGNITVYDSDTGFVYIFDNDYWFEFTKSIFEDNIKTIDKDIEFRKILQNDRIDQLNKKYNKSAKVKYFTIKDSKVNLYEWDATNNQFSLRLKDVPKTKLKNEYIVTNVKSDQKIKDNSDTYTLYSLGQMELKKVLTELWISSTRIEIVEK